MGETLSGAVVVVTGAGSGIGRAIAVAFGRAGARVHVADLHRERADETARLIADAGGHATAHALDCRAFEQVRALADAIHAAEGRVDVLCNNAGVGHAGMAHEMPLERWHDVIRTNLFGAVHGVAAFLPRMLAQAGRAHIVNTASVAGLMGLAGMAAYSASKFGVVGLTEALSTEIDPAKVRMHALCPGMVASNLVRDSDFRSLGVVDKDSTIAYYRDFAAPPEQVAADLLEAIVGDRSLVLSAAGPYAWLWRLKRLCMPLYLRLSRFLVRETFSKGWPRR